MFIYDNYYVIIMIIMIFSLFDSSLMANSPSNTPSPKKRQLPAIPTDAQRESRDRGYCIYYGEI